MIYSEANEKESEAMEVKMEERRHFMKFNRRSVKANINQLFHKIYQFKETQNWNIPTEAFKATKWTVPTLQTMKRELNEVKGRLNDVDLNKWSRHTKHRDPSGFIIKQLRQNYNIELLTHAWCKFYECLSKFKLVSLDMLCKGTFSSLHLCEAPGAFVCALNHYLQSNAVGIHLNWVGSTLNPYHEGCSLSSMIPDDRLIKHTEKNWCFGIDSTGDITKFYNYEYLVSRLNDNQCEKRCLVTADGSVDCMQDPGNQEIYVEFLHYCETITALSVLKEGGSFVLKIFTTFEHSTISLLYLLNCVFAEVALFKPCCSRSGNSEVYVVCTNFKGCVLLSNIWEQLLIPYRNGSFSDDISMFERDALPQTFIHQIIAASEFFKKFQERTIIENLHWFRLDDKQAAREINMFKNSVAIRFIKKLKIKEIIEDLKLVPCHDLIHEWRKLAECNYVFGRQSSTDLINNRNYVIDVKLGKQIDTVNNSRFVSVSNLSKFNECLLIDEELPLLYRCTENMLNSKYIIFNIRKFKTYNEFQSSLFSHILNNSDKEFIFVETPFLTHVAAGLLYILIDCFEIVNTDYPGIIFLQNLLKDKMTEIKASLQSQIEGVIKSDLFQTNVIHVIQPLLFDTNHVFFNFVCSYNTDVANKLCKKLSSI